MSNYAQNCANKRYRVPSAEETQYTLDVLIPYWHLMLEFEKRHWSVAIVLHKQWIQNRLSTEQKLGRVRMLMNE